MGPGWSWISTAEARRLVAAEMESFYKVPFAAFEKYTPFGTATQVAESLRPYVDAGCSLLNLKVVADSRDTAIDAAAEIGQLLRN